MNAVWLRLVYIIEFLVAVPAVYTLWSQVGGQGHLDLMPWYWKLALGCAAGLAIVRLSAAVISQERVVTLRSFTWMVCVLMVAVAMGMVTYYYHLHEATEETDQEDATTAAILWDNHAV